MPILPTHWVGTDVGIARDLNEDAFLWLGPDDTEGRGWLWLVADGLGGAAAGDLAAAMVVTTFEDTWAVALEETRSFCAAAEAVIAETCARIAGVEASFPQLRGMSAAVAIVACVDSMVWTAHAGDCRVMRVRDGHAEPLTRDHIAVAGAAELARRPAPALGEIQRLSRHVGSAGVQLEFSGPIAVIDADVFTITSDGVHGVVDTSTFVEACGHSPQEAVEWLVSAAREGWSDDNLTAAVIAFRTGSRQAELPPRSNVTSLPGPTPSPSPAAASASPPNPLLGIDATRTLSFSPDLLRSLTTTPAPPPASPLASRSATSTLLLSRADIAAIESSTTHTGLLAGRIIEAARRSVENPGTDVPRAGNAPMVGLRAAAGVGGDLGAPRQRMEPSRPVARTRRSDETAPVALEIDEEPIQQFSQRVPPVALLVAVGLAAVVVAFFLFRSAEPSAPPAPDLGLESGPVSGPGSGEGSGEGSE